VVQHQTLGLEITWRGSSSAFTLRWGLRHQPESAEKLKQKVQEETTDLFAFLKLFCIGKFGACVHKHLCMTSLVWGEGILPWRCQTPGCLKSGRSSRLPCQGEMCCQPEGRNRSEMATEMGWKPRRALCCKLGCLDRAGDTARSLQLDPGQHWRSLHLIFFFFLSRKTLHFFRQILH